MKFATAVVCAASAVVFASAQNIPNPCVNPNGVYCAGGTIIIRCSNGNPEPGNCSDNLDGEPPQGINGASCYQQSPGFAACAKNGIVYGGSGNLNGTFTEPSSSSTTSTTSSTPVSITTTSSTPIGSNTIVPPPHNGTTYTSTSVTTLPGQSATATPSGPSTAPSTTIHVGAAPQVQQAGSIAAAVIGLIYAAVL